MEGSSTYCPSDNGIYLHISLSTMQPVCVMSTNGGGRSGCLCALACAYQMMTDPIPEPPSWEPDQNILDQVRTEPNNSVVDKGVWKEHKNVLLSEFFRDLSIPVFSHFMKHRGLVVGFSF